MIRLMFAWERIANAGDTWLCKFISDDELHHSDFVNLSLIFFFYINTVLIMCGDTVHLS